MKTSLKTIAIIAALAASTALIGCAGPAGASTKMSEAEALFKDCEKQAKQSMAGSGDAGICSVNYEFILKEKFGGDFNKLMEWWKTDVKPFTQTAPSATGKYSV